MLLRREALKLIGQEGAYSTEDHLTLLQEGRNLTPKKLNDGLRHDFQGKWVPSVPGGQLLLVLAAACQPPFPE